MISLVSSMEKLSCFRGSAPVSAEAPLFPRKRPCFRGSAPVSAEAPLFPRKRPCFRGSAPVSAEAPLFPHLARTPSAALRKRARELVGLLVRGGSQSPRRISQALKPLP